MPDFMGHFEEEPRPRMQQAESSTSVDEKRCPVQEFQVAGVVAACHYEQDTRTGSADMPPSSRQASAAGMFDCAKKGIAVGNSATVEVSSDCGPVEEPPRKKQMGLLGGMPFYRTVSKQGRAKATLQPPQDRGFIPAPPKGCMRSQSVYVQGAGYSLREMCTGGDAGRRDNNNDALQAALQPPSEITLMRSLSADCVPLSQQKLQPVQARTQKSLPVPSQLPKPDQECLSYRHVGEQALQQRQQIGRPRSPTVIIESVGMSGNSAVMLKLYRSEMELLIEKHQLSEADPLHMPQRSFRPSLLRFLSFSACPPASAHTHSRHGARVPLLPTAAAINIASHLPYEFLAPDPVKRLLVIPVSEIGADDLGYMLTALLVDTMSGIEDLLMIGFPDLCVMQLVQLTRKLSSVTIVDEGIATKRETPLTLHRVQSPVSFHQDLYHGLVDANCHASSCGSPEEKPLFELTFKTSHVSDGIRCGYKEYLQAIRDHNKRFEPPTKVVRATWQLVLPGEKSAITLQEDFSVFHRITRPIAAFLEESINHSGACANLGLYLDLRNANYNRQPKNLRSMFLALMTSTNLNSLTVRSLAFPVNDWLVRALADVITYSGSLEQIDLGQLATDHESLDHLLAAIVLSSSLRNVTVPCMLASEASHITAIIRSAPLVEHIRVILAGVEYSEVSEKMSAASETAIVRCKTSIQVDIADGNGEEMVSFVQSAEGSLW